MLKKLKQLVLVASIGVMGVACSPEPDQRYIGDSCTIELTDENFKSEILEPEGTAVVDFYATWCSYYSQLKPIFEKLSCEYEGEMKFGEYDVDLGDYDQKYGINGLPTLLFYCQGEPTFLSRGLIPEEIIIDFIEKVISDCE
jgi:thioredoxin-like negative regulator of GroEL